MTNRFSTSPEREYLLSCGKEELKKGDKFTFTGTSYFEEPIGFETTLKEIGFINSLTESVKEFKKYLKNEKYVTSAKELNTNLLFGSFPPEENSIVGVLIELEGKVTEQFAEKFNNKREKELKKGLDEESEKRKKIIEDYLKLREEVENVWK